MACFYCQVCDRLIDLDYDVEHYERCPTLPDEEEEELTKEDKKMAERVKIRMAWGAWVDSLGETLH